MAQIMPMTDLDARADRVRAITEANCGRVIGCDGDMMLGEVPVARQSVQTP